MEDELAFELRHLPHGPSLGGNVRYGAITEDLPKYHYLTYEAVSYAWQTDSGAVVVEVKYRGKRYAWTIRCSVETMLRHLRLRGERQRYLWVDALSLNQSDNQEKSVQVARMGTIYSKARKVLVWLGTDDEYLDGGGTTLRRIKAGRVSQESTVLEIDNLLSRRWFGRRWVIQEVAFAQEAVVSWGSRDKRGASSTTTMTVATLADAFEADLIDAHGHKDLPRSYFMNWNARKAWSLNFALAQRGWLPVRTRAEKRLRTLDKGVQKRFMDVRARLKLMSDGTLKRNQRHTLCQLLCQFNQTQCENARDRLYALNSLSFCPFEVDYTNETEEIYKRFALT